ncbi:MAG: ribose-phosphate pyrophosphokinase [Micavibrio aeruginosavorus]|uniref:Ribose-phosphate pyrophosphokinase n=1 Tax=Micavibrio aeruginosavorus TaxID=349221 RepID=A0A2W5A3H6_9BACT|nr:MAG: ribose-phosphate pyrophosphokinase [Micavibrio aeruginosavorus]
MFDLDQIEALLRASAKEGRSISYAETLNCIGLEFSRPKMRALCIALGEIDRRAKARGEPELAVLVVRASDGLPGAGWWTEKDGRRYNGPWEGPEAEAYIKKRQKKTFAYWKKQAE